MPSLPNDMPRSPEQRHLFYSGILLVLTVVCYLRVFSNGFIEGYDDELYVTLNSVVARGLTLQGVTWSLTAFTAGNWHPLTWWSHMADVSLFGMNPAGHHAVSLIIHCANALLLYSLFFRITGLRGRSFIVAAVFSLHPLHVESVAWVAERKDLLSTFFGLGALHAYISFVRSGRRMFYPVMWLLFCLSLMAKPMLVTFPFLLLVLDYWPLERMRQHQPLRLLLEKLPLLLPVAVVSAVTLLAQRSAGALVSLTDDTLTGRSAAALYAYVVYLRKFLAPYDLTSYYPRAGVPASAAVASAAALIMISLLVWRCRKGRPWLTAGWLWYLGLLVPVIGIVRVGAQAYADRYTYLPLVGVTVIAVWGGAELLERSGMAPRIRCVLASAVIILCGALTVVQTGYWKDDATLYSRELAVVRGNWHGHLGLGNMLVKRGHYGEGIEHYYAVLAANPDSSLAHRNLGLAFGKAGDLISAQTHFRTAIRLRPGAEENYLSLAHTLYIKGDLSGYVTVAGEGVRMVPSSPALRANLALALQRNGRVDEAVSAYRQALNLDPGFLSVYAPLGALYAEHGKTAELRNLLEQLKLIDPAEAQALSSRFRGRTP